MALMPGSRFGCYEVVGEIGAGGMGEVYRAIDTTLDREVAIKTLPSALAADTDRLARFEREARLLATLNHPNIAVIYGLEEHDGARCIAMELVHGETLEEKLKDGPLSLEDALGLALQIAYALEAAHEKGVVHRDLKPANVMITAKGQVKVLDFGLAKAFSDDSNQETLGHSPALSLAMTQQGLILGTASYMSPEQASGQAIDQRADVWAFGVVLFEMLSGFPLFSGESVPHILADVLKTEPDWNRLPKHLDPRLKRVLGRCLAKKLHSRYHAIADARIDIEEILSDPQDGESLAVDAANTRSRPVLPWVAASAAAAAIVAGGISWVLRPAPEPQPLTRFSHRLPAAQTFRGPGWPMIAISPDGSRFAYNTIDGLYLRAMDELEARLVAGTEPALDTMTFSPDGQSLAYWSVPAELRRIGILGGVPIELSALQIVFGMSWPLDGTIFYAGIDGIYRAPANGGMPERVISTEGSFKYGAELLPDGDSVLFSVFDESSVDVDTTEIVVQSLSTGERKVLLRGGNDARYLPTGHIVYALGDALFAVAFDAETLTVSGGPVPVVQNVLRAPLGQSGVAHYDVSDTGTLIYVAGGIVAVARTLVWVDRDGNEEPISSAPPRAYTSPRLSPDGAKLVFNARDEELDVWTWDLVRGGLTRLTFEPAQNRFPLWSPDGQRVVFESQTVNGSTLLWQPADGSGQPEELASTNGELFAHAFLPDASGIVVYGDFTGANANEDIALVRLDGSQTVEPLLATAFRETLPDISPDGRWLAYVSNESGRSEVYVRPFPDVDRGGRWPVSTDGGTSPLWSHDGSELFYRNGEAMMAVRIEPGESFDQGNPEVLFEGEYASPQGGRTYDYSAERDRFLMMKDVRDPSATSEIVVVQNWFEQLERLVPRTN